MIWFMGFVFLFSLGGMTGVMLAVPGIDFQMHNSLFLVAHFHTMIVSGVLFGFLAGLTYWFPKIFGFTLHEGLGKTAAWLWNIGFFLAFAPLFVLGMMGATRRLDHYDASTGWQPLFIIAGVGAAIIGLGVVCQLLQVFVSFRQRKKNIDTTGDPWNGRTLEWSTVSPAPFYNYAIIPTVNERDPFWEAKQKGKKLVENPHYTDIHLPKNSGAGVIIAGFSFLVGFAAVWHIPWLAAIGAIGVITVMIIRLTDDDTEYTITAAQIQKLEAAYADKEQPA
jgi:cytochrome o ubiquinol oxidase subunit 1